MHSAMNEHFKSAILKATGAKDLVETDIIQSLWSGYGEIVRISLIDGSTNSVVVKHVSLTEQGQHPRGWNTDFSHLRKMKSYQVETAWYDEWSHHCDLNCRVPECLALETQENEVLIVLEDLDEAGFPGRRATVNLDEIKTCLNWLAHFHALFMGVQPDKLWQSGTYWHLDTRPDELDALTDVDLKNAAALIDQRLRNSPFQTLVHGDAKLANFCFSEDGARVAAVDFQYVGGGCGVKDVAYFISSCLDEEECQGLESDLLDFYFDRLKTAIKAKHKNIDADAVELDWRELYPVAWTDFYRFLKGWSPGHWKIHSYSERLSREVLAQLNQVS